MLFIGYAMLAIAVSGILYGINEVFIEDDGDDVPVDDMMDVEDPTDDEEDDAPDGDDDTEDDPDDDTPDEDPADEGDDDDADDAEDEDPVDDEDDARAVTFDVDANNDLVIIEDFDPETDLLNLTIDADQVVNTLTDTESGDPLLLVDDEAKVQFQNMVQPQLPEDAIQITLREGEGENAPLARALGLRVLDGTEDGAVLDSDAYVFGSNFSDDLMVSGGTVVANLGVGNDTYTNIALEGGSELVITSSTADSAVAQSPDLNAIQRVFGGQGDDTLDAGFASAILMGQQGDDLLNAGSAPGIVDGGEGADTLNGVDSDLVGDVPQWRLLGGSGDDMINGGDAAETIWGDDAEGSEGAGSDVILAGGGDDIVRGGDGADSISGGTGDDILDHRGDADLDRDDTGVDFTRLSDQAADTIDGGEGDDTIRADQFDTLTGGTGADQFEVAHDTRLMGGAAATITDFEAGEDMLIVQLDPSQLPDDAGDMTEIAPALVPDGADTLVQIEGVTIAVLQNVSDVTPADVQVIVMADQPAA